MLSVFVTELPTNFERQLFVDISEEIVNTRTTELNLSRVNISYARRHIKFE